ncbi:MAG: peptide chain release factor N(5)-glutamine methyltransferase [Acidobacteria bacterium]|nr:peptide chain release factor N(5)-glutamine methyltransferase [Acidobacteriota bacterium]
MATETRVSDLIRQCEAAIRARAGGSARIEAEVLAGHVLGRSRAWLLTHPEGPVSGRDRGRFRRLTGRRARGVPLQYLTGRQEFWSLEFLVNRHTLIPRPESELLVEEALRRVPRAPSLLVDIGTGCGNLAVALASELPRSRVFAVDRSAAALAVARRNARAHGVSRRIRFLRGSLYRPLEGLGLEGRADAVVSNPPYVSARDFKGLMREVREHEPRMALVAGPTGLEFYPPLVAGAERLLRGGGVLILEIGAGESRAVGKILAASSGFDAVEFRRDGAGIQRVAVARRRSGDAR